MILALIAIVPIILERVHNERFDRLQRIDAAHEQALGLARRAAAVQNDAIVSTRTLLHVLAATHTISVPAKPSCGPLFKSIAEPEQWIRNLSVADRDGTIVCSSNPEAIGLNIKDRPHFIAAVETGSFFLSDYFMGTRDKAPLMVASLPQHDADGAVNSVLLAILDPSWLGQIAGTLAMRSGSVLVLIDGNGTVLAQEPRPAKWVGRRLKDHPFVESMKEQREGVVLDASLDGVRRIFAFSQLPGTRAHVAVGFDENEVLSRINSTMWTSLAELAAVAAFVLLGIWFGGERLLVRPIRTLANMAGHIGRGEAKAPAAAMPWVAEFVPLAVAIDDMAAKLTAREQELRESNLQLRELAEIDALTGLANRRSFNERLVAEWKLARELHRPIAILMIDVDFFKRFNDRYGHVQGDTCLRKLAGVLTASSRTHEKVHSAFLPELPSNFHLDPGSARAVDFAARYGGEEFAILLQGANLEVAMRVGERLRQAVEDLLMAHAGAPWGFVSISVGAASMLPAQHDSPLVLTETADAALYQAKREGRNRVLGSESAALARAS